MKYRVLVSAPYMQPVIDRFRPELAAQGIELVIPPVNERLTEDELLHLVGDIDGVIAGDDQFTERVLASAPRLKVLSKWGTGIDSFDRDACARRGIAIRNTPNAFSEPVADSVFGYMLCFARQLPFMDRAMRDGQWRKYPGVSLGESVLGVIGVGNVGKAVIRRARAFGMRILGTDPVRPPETFLAETGTLMVEKDRLLEQADFVSLNADLNPTSFHIISDAEFGRMKRTAVLVNTARGQLIDHPALVRALQAGEIAGAGLDVFEQEPLPADDPLLELANVMVAPHNANSSPRAWERVHRSTIDNLLAELARERASAA
jgi:D-3-phosphoglycerate dehydrogenase / 2-oxoglutarate reductase